mmetsp:Transcript_48876/g.156539  ORF Transcript_48876/g.156539 Transcript_48876/m.156539 type:complete len:122 (-) Transcript_48876:44-409(-)|eukprot:CAMPEP_0182864376 /NCGR_PEP_ID=MMETSP0034_2-20130328/7137_1 /TAXON_ID=156128 /ORGANISM="Nephroselmis pyriformis, Strain CCMP717" /LENGTH=121 /DNA_ID=CAMNT_0024996631 /DNA_START=287 /DNA_END=652 /DNA_ORIENTATION=-
MGWFGGGGGGGSGGSSGASTSFESGDSFGQPTGGFPAGGGGPGGNAQVMNQVQQEIAAQELQAFVTVVRDKCFETCVKSPGSSLSSSETNCLARCFDRYVEATKAVSQSVFSAMQNGASGM